MTQQQKIWQLSVISKTKLFLYKVLHGIIHTKINLISRFVDVDPFSLRCGLEVETGSMHSLEIVVYRSSISTRFDLDRMEVWIDRALSHFNMEIFCVFATTLWTISFACNILVFQGSSLAD